MSIHTRITHVSSQQKKIHLHTFDEYPHYRDKFVEIVRNPNLSNEEKIVIKQKLEQEWLIAILSPHQLPLTRSRNLTPHDQTFYPPFFEKIQLSYYRIRNKYCVIQPFAGGPGRDMPSHILKQVIDEAYLRGFTIYMPVRDTIRGFGAKKQIYPREELPTILDAECRRKISFIELTIPGVIELIRTCDFFVGTDSAFIKAAWGFRRHNIFLIHPQAYQNEKFKKCIEQGIGYCFGIYFPETYASSFGDFDIQQAKKKMKKMKNSFWDYFRMFF